MVKYKLTNIKAHCPVCGEKNAKILYNVNNSQSANQFVLKELDEEKFNKLKKNIKKLWQTGNCKVVSCKNCDFCYAYPYIAGDSNFYNIAFGEGGYPSWKFEYELTFNTIKKLLKSKNSNKIQLLEIGAGNGAFVKKISPGFIPKKNILCTEYSKSGSNNIRNYGVCCIAKDFREMKDTKYKNKFSIICLFQVLEHLDNLEQTFKSLNFLSSKEASLFIAVPNARRIEFNEKNEALLDMPPNHIGRWNKKCFEVICKKYQWKIMDYKIEPGELNSSLNQFSNYKYLRNRQTSNSIDNRIALIKNNTIRSALERLIKRYYKIASLKLMKMNFHMIGNSQWIHLKKV